MGRLSENSVVSIKNKSFSVTAEVDVPDGGADGVIIAQGGRFGGWAVYAKDGTAKFVYNVLGIHEFATEADAPIPAGTHQVRMEFAYDGGGLAKGGDVTLYYDGTAVGTGRVDATQPMIFSADETTDIGYESGTTVTPDYTAHDQPVHRQDQLGPDRPRRRRPRPLHRPRRTPPHRHGPPVGSNRVDPNLMPLGRCAGRVGTEPGDADARQEGSVSSSSFWAEAPCSQRQAEVGWFD